MTARSGHRRPSLALVAMLAASVGFGGCASDQESGDDKPRSDTPTEPAATVEEEDVEEGDVDPTSLPLEEVEDSGIEGTATVTPGDGDALQIEVELTKDDGETHGIEARLGSCKDALSKDVADEVMGGATSYTLADIEDGATKDSAKLPDEIVSDGTYSLVVYAGPEVEGDIAACADVEVA